MQKLLQNYTVIAKILNVNFIDAPVSGGQAGAENGQLTIMLGGDEEYIQ